MQEKIRKQYKKLLEELEMHEELGLKFSYQCTLTTINELKRKYPFLTDKDV